MPSPPNCQLPRLLPASAHRARPEHRLFSYYIFIPSPLRRLPNEGQADGLYHSPLPSRRKEGRGPGLGCGRAGRSGRAAVRLAGVCGLWGRGRQGGRHPAPSLKRQRRLAVSINLDGVTSDRGTCAGAEEDGWR